jgi:ribonuclease P protein component
METAPIPRLKRRGEFLNVARKGRKWVMPGMVVQACDALDDTGDRLRVGFTVSRKVGNAVKRNRARRRLRAVAERLLPVNTKGGIDVVIIGRVTTLNRSFDKLTSDLAKALLKLDVLDGQTD